MAAERKVHFCQGCGPPEAVAGGPPAGGPLSMYTPAVRKTDSVDDGRNDNDQEEEEGKRKREKGRREKKRRGGMLINVRKDSDNMNRRGIDWNEKENELDQNPLCACMKQSQKNTHMRILTRR